MCFLFMQGKVLGSLQPYAIQHTYDNILNSKCHDPDDIFFSQRRTVK